MDIYECPECNMRSNTKRLVILHQRKHAMVKYSWSDRAKRKRRDRIEAVAAKRKAANEAS